MIDCLKREYDFELHYMITAKWVRLVVFLIEYQGVNKYEVSQVILGNYEMSVTNIQHHYYHYLAPSSCYSSFFFFFIEDGIGSRKREGHSRSIKSISVLNSVPCLHPRMIDWC